MRSKNGSRDKVNGFKFNGSMLLALLMMTAIVVLSGTAFIIMVAFGLFGLSRILIYFHLAEFSYNQSFADNLFYYGSYIVGGYFLLVVLEYVCDELKKRYPDFILFQGYKFHLFTISVSTICFYLLVHINYQYIHINFIVIFIIIALLYILTELFYPDSEDLNQHNK